MFCRKCGSELADGAKFCGKCGTAVSGLDSNNGNQEGRSPNHSGNNNSGLGQPINNGSYNHSYHHDEMKVNVQVFDFIKLFLLSIVTCGFYSLYFFYRTTEDYNALADKYGVQPISSFLKAILLGIVTCGIYTIYWQYKYCELACNIAAIKRVKLPADNPGILFLFIYFIPVYNYIVLAEMTKALAQGE